EGQVRDVDAGTPFPPPKAEPSPTIRPEVFVGDDAAKNERIVRDNFAAKAKRFLRYIPLGSEAVAMYFCMLDGKTPLWVKGTVAAALALCILPLDALPDILPIVGMTDDAGVIAAALAAVSAYLTDEHRRKAADWLEAEQIVVEGKVRSEPA